ncbi:hypothetical protein ZIOFF_012088 [Zingiber officinale]|uniref:Uncharacterized protein n=1 Tax=Zingiber officinale TaxID=94328 RepID=A0A8J5HL85_ZINOF|nr:hypothetical protein ZIOFF_012088 [Zingiber officinale]
MENNREERFDVFLHSRRYQLLTWIVHWDADGGKPLELNRILRPGAFNIFEDLVSLILFNFNITASVISIDLHNPYANASDPRYDMWNLRGRVDHSLLQFKFLRHLNLSYNNFNDLHIPRFIGFLKRLSIARLAQQGKGLLASAGSGCEYRSDKGARDDVRSNDLIGSEDCERLVAVAGMLPVAGRRKQWRWR